MKIQIHPSLRNISATIHIVAQGHLLFTCEALDCLACEELEQDNAQLHEDSFRVCVRP